MLFRGERFMHESDVRRIFWTCWRLHLYTGAQSPPARNDALWCLETRRYIPSGTISQGQIISFCGDASCCAWSKSLRFSVNDAKTRQTDGFHALRDRWINRGEDGWCRLCRVTSETGMPPETHTIFSGTPRNCCRFILFLCFSLSVTTCCRQVTTRYMWVCFWFL